MAEAKQYRRKQDGFVVGPFTVSEMAGLAGWAEKEWEEVPAVVIPDKGAAKAPAKSASKSKPTGKSKPATKPATSKPAAKPAPAASNAAVPGQPNPEPDKGDNA